MLITRTCTCAFQIFRKELSAHGQSRMTGYYGDLSIHFQKTGNENCYIIPYLSIGQGLVQDMKKNDSLCLSSKFMI